MLIALLVFYFVKQWHINYVKRIKYKVCICVMFKLYIWIWNSVENNFDSLYSLRARFFVANIALWHEVILNFNVWACLSYFCYIVIFTARRENDAKLIMRVV